MFCRNRLNEDLMGFADSDWAGHPNSQRSVSGYTFMFCRAAVSWSAKKQPTITLSSTKAKYMVMTHAGKEAIFLEHLYGDVGIPISVPILLLIDNQSTIALAENPIFHACSKHIKVHHHWVHEKIKDGTIKLDYIPMANVTIGSPIVWIYSQVADLGSACKLAPQSPGLPQTERLSMRVLKSILKLREVSPLAWELYTVSRKGQVTKHK